MESNIKELSDELTHKDLYTEIKLVKKDLEIINIGILRIEKANEDIKGTYVTKDQFSPVRNIAYGMVSLVLVAVIGAILSGVIIKSNAEAIPISQNR